MKPLLPQSPFALWWCQTSWLEVFLYLFFQGLQQRECLFRDFRLPSWSHDQNTLEYVSCLKYSTWLASAIRWQLKWWFVALSKVSSTSFARPTSQRCRFFFYYPPFNAHVFTSYRTTEKTSDCINLFLVFLKISLFHMTFRLGKSPRFPFWNGLDF